MLISHDFSKLSVICYDFGYYLFGGYWITEFICIYIVWFWLRKDFQCFCYLVSLINERLQSLNESNINNFSQLYHFERKQKLTIGKLSNSLQILSK